MVMGVKQKGPNLHKLRYNRSLEIKAKKKALENLNKTLKNGMNFQKPTTNTFVFQRSRYGKFSKSLDRVAKNYEKSLDKKGKYVLPEITRSSIYGSGFHPKASSD